jgi:hypothetical protein
MTKKISDDVWEATDEQQQTILVRVIFPQAAPLLVENGHYVIPDIRQYDKELGQEVYLIEGDLIRPLDVEDP